MVDTLVSGASASRRVGSTPISGTNKKADDIRSSAFFVGVNFSASNRHKWAQRKIPVVLHFHPPKATFSWTEE